MENLFKESFFKGIQQVPKQVLSTVVSGINATPGLAEYANVLGNITNATQNLTLSGRGNQLVPSLLSIMTPRSRSQSLASEQNTLPENRSRQLSQSVSPSPRSYWSQLSSRSSTPDPLGSSPPVPLGSSLPSSVHLHRPVALRSAVPIRHGFPNMDFKIVPPGAPRAPHPRLFTPMNTIPSASVLEKNHPPRSPPPSPLRGGKTRKRKSTKKRTHKKRKIK